MNKRIAVLGCGWLGFPLAVSLVKKGYVVNGSTTSEEKLAKLQLKGIKPFVLRLSEDKITGQIDTFLADASILIINVPPNLRGKHQESYVKKMQLLHQKTLQSSIKQVIFVSSTSVYGTIEGEVVEASTPLPVTASGRQLMAAESIFRNSETLQTCIVRFGGLLGGDRHPVKILSGKKELKNGSHPVNLIHRNDCIGIIEHILLSNCWGEIINGVYPYHPSKQEYYTKEAAKFKIQPPEYQEDNSIFNKKVIPKALLNVKEFCFKTSICS